MPFRHGQHAALRILGIDAIHLLRDGQNRPRQKTVEQNRDHQESTQQSRPKGSQQKTDVKIGLFALIEDHDQAADDLLFTVKVKGPHAQRPDDAFVIADDQTG